MHYGDIRRVQGETWLLFRQLDEELADGGLERDCRDIARPLCSGYGEKRRIYAQTRELKRIARRAEHRARE